MKRVWIGLAFTLCAALLVLAGSSSPAYAQATSTYTPTPTAAFVLPLINVPIILPTAFMPPQPTPISVHVTAAPNGNPLGLQIPANPVWIWLEGRNWASAIFKVLGWAGYLLFFVLLVMICLSLLFNIRRAAMGQPSLYSKALGSSGKGRRSKK